MPDSPAPPDGWTLDITASDEHVYDVSVAHASGARTRHCVTVPGSLLVDLGLSAAQEPLLLRTSLAYLLEHSPSGLPDRFDLDEIGRAIPSYRDDIVARI